MAYLPSAPPPTAREYDDRGIPGRAQSSTSRFGPFDDNRDDSYSLNDDIYSLASLLSCLVKAAACSWQCGVGPTTTPTPAPRLEHASNSGSVNHVALRDQFGTTRDLRKRVTAIYWGSKWLTGHTVRIQFTGCR